MMTLISGTPGAGKTLYAVDMIRAERARSPDRSIYSDIDGLHDFGVLPMVDDWRETPEGSLLVYDEAHVRFPGSGRPGPSSIEAVNRMDTHRHTGHDMVFVTQWPNKIDHVIRSLIGRHVHLSRQMGIQAANVHEWDHVQAKPNDYHERMQANTSRWHYPKDLYDKYVSATDHATHNKIRIPRRMLALGLTIVGLFGVSGYMFFQSDGLAPSSSALSHQIEQAEPSPAVLPVPIVVGCAASDTYCACYDLDGLPIVITQSQCRSMMLRPIRAPVVY